jgi:hypothetical protein
MAKLEDMSKPMFFCFSRSVLGLVGVHAETPGAAFQLIVPLMFFAIAIRLVAHGIGYAGVAMGDEAGMLREEEEEKRRLLLQQQAVIDPLASHHRGEEP